MAVWISQLCDSKQGTWHALCMDRLGVKGRLCRAIVNPATGMACSNSIVFRPPFYLKVKLLRAGAKLQVARAVQGGLRGNP